MTDRPIRIVLVDDSLTVRAVLRRLLGADPAIEIVGEAADGAGGVEVVRRLEPDVVVMDLELPGMSGLEASREIRRHLQVPIVVVTSTARRELVEGAFRAMDDGVVGVFQKPDVPEQWHELSLALREIARRVAAPVPSAPRARPEGEPQLPGRGDVRLIAVGASTGGPAALRTMLAAMGGAPSAAVVVVQHIAEGFADGLAGWLASDTGLDVRVAAVGDHLVPGAVRIAPSGSHLRVTHDGTLLLDHETPAVRGHRPSADVLFRSIAEIDPGGTVAVLLTGMGTDGADGLVRLRRAGAVTVVQSEETCTVFGMPRAALERGGSELSLSPAEIGRMLARMAPGTRP